MKLLLAAHSLPMLDFAPLIATVGVALLATLCGVFPILKVIRMNEARHELKRGSAGFIRSMSGWTITLVWVAATWFCATITGDWWATGDLDGALARSGERLQVLLHILAALGDS